MTIRSLGYDGSIGERNDVAIAGLNHKMGQGGVTNTVLNFGDTQFNPGGENGAVGYLVGEENRGLEYMFVMMNVARFGVGMEGVSVSERAYQRARDYANERIQGTDIGVRGGPRVPIIAHPDVRRMLMTMRAQAEATRALALLTLRNLGRQGRVPDAASDKPDADAAHHAAALQFMRLHAHRHDLDVAAIAKIADTFHAWKADGETTQPYEDVPGFCRSVPLSEVAEHGHVLTPGRYVGAEEVEDDDEAFADKMQKLTEKLGEQMAKGAELDALIRQKLGGLGYEF